MGNSVTNPKERIWKILDYAFQIELHSFGPIGCRYYQAVDTKHKYSDVHYYLYAKHVWIRTVIKWFFRCELALMSYLLPVHTLITSKYIHPIIIPQQQYEVMRVRIFVFRLLMKLQLSQVQAYKNFRQPAQATVRKLNEQGGEELWYCNRQALT